MKENKLDNTVLVIDVQLTVKQSAEGLCKAVADLAKCTHLTPEEEATLVGENTIKYDRT